MKSYKVTLAEDHLRFRQVTKTPCLKNNFRDQIESIHILKALALVVALSMRP
jgi:hypothetical protein